MSVADAQTARAMATKVSRAMPGIQQNFYTTNPLLQILQERGGIKWRGSATEVEWFVRKEPDSSDTPSWGGGELGINTFEEFDPANKVSLPYSWLQRNYGVSDRTLESGRHAAGKFKIYDALKENLTLAKISLYKAFAPAIWDGDGGDGDGDANGEIVGVIYACGNPYETSDDVTIAALQSYANKTLETGGISAYAAKKASWDDPQWAPECFDINELKDDWKIGAGASWAGDCLIALAFIEEQMAVTASVSGTGTNIRPDYAFMGALPWAGMVDKWITTTGNWQVPLASKSLKLSGWSNMAVGGLTVVRDDNVPVDSGSEARVVVVDSSQIKLHTTHTQKEGLIKNEFSADNILITGAVGTLKMNICLVVASPTAVGCITGCTTAT